MIDLSLEALRDFLNAQGHEARIQLQTDQVYFSFTIEGHEFPLFVRIPDTKHLLQVMVFIPGHIDKSYFNATGRLLHLLNKELDMPGFGMDERVGVVFYRLALPLHEGKIHRQHLLTYIDACKAVMEGFSPVILAVGNGTLSFEEAVKKAEAFHEAIMRGDIKPS